MLNQEKQLAQQSDRVAEACMPGNESSAHASTDAFSYLINNKFIRYLVPPSILAAITAVVYYPSLHYPFQFDDIANITKHFAIRFDNPLVRLWNNSRWLGDWLNTLNFKVGRFDPFYYRFSNITIHILTGICAYYLVYELCKLLEKRPFFPKHASLIAFFTSGLFLLHPVQTQTVSYVIQARLEGIASFFVLLASLLYVKAVKTERWTTRIAALAGLGLCCFVACGTKEIVIALPFLLLLIDWFFISQEEWDVFKKRLLIFGVLSIGFVLFLVQHIGSSLAAGLSMLGMILTFRSGTANNRGNILTQGAFDTITPWMFLISEFKVILHYLLIFIWPFNLSVEYDWKIASGFFSFEVILPLIVLVALYSFVIRCAWRKQYPALTFGLLWFLIVVAPRSTIIPSAELVVDYKTYLASLGVLFLFATVITYVLMFVWARIKDLPAQCYAYESRLGLLTVLLIFVGLGAYERNKVWQTCVDFWTDNAQKAPNKARVHNNLGVALSEAGRLDESIMSYKRAISLDAHYADPWSNLAVAYSLKNEIDKAIESLKGAIHICPNYPEAYNNLGSLLLQKKLYSDAERALHIAIQLRPYYGKAYYNMARLFEEQNNADKAWDFLKKATEGDLDTPEVFFKLGQLSFKVKKYPEAAQAFEGIIKRGVNNDQVWFNLANAYFMMAKHEKALSIYERLVRDNPVDARYAYNLAETLFTKGDFDKACEVFRRTTTLPQPIPQAFFRVAHCLEHLNRVPEAKSFLEEMLTLNAADDFKKAVRNEITRISLQQKLNEGKGSIHLKDLKQALALRNPEAHTTKVASRG